ncbi:hypothetical protein AAFF_G00230440 [Aldrovandia affinis]|uniref:C-type lectin domain-containing protein n=1 Tax=Aldrovandia affinis TaxID=143900 RepID=A0AAD7W520_9TELE|nr:hypothetical protein AAFF_G00230440 [Aldrovandia affinis]
MDTSTVSNRSEGIYIGLDSPDQDVYSTVGQTSHNSPGAQHTERSGQTSHPYRLAGVCLGLLCALLLTPSIVLGILYTSASQLRRDNDRLNTQKDQLQRDLDAVVVKFPLLDQYCPLRSQKRVCRPCPEGWEQSNSKCYYFSTVGKSWNDSRSDCLKQGADLVIIESEEEQKFISNHTRESYYWIGLSDSETEGTFLWVDGTPLQDDKAFWGRDSQIIQKGLKTV